MKTIFNLFIVIALTIVSCKKEKVTSPDPLPPPNSPVNNPNTGSLEIEFEGMVGDSNLELSTKTYTNQAGNTFNITLFEYYISNIKLIKSDNSVWAEPNSYHLVDYANTSSPTISLQNIPYGNYKSIEFMIGVDSARNVSGAQTGALDPVYGMFWTWSSGYIMAKMEGTSPQSTATANKLIFHIGGFSGPNKVLKTVSPSFNTDSAIVSSSVIPSIHMKCDLSEWFKTPSNTDFSVLNTVHMEGSSAKAIADNYADMFSVEHIHNN